MSLKVTVEGQESFEIAKECVTKVVYRTDIPLDSDARSKDMGSSLEISGKILASTEGDAADSTRQLDLWAMIPAEDVNCYRKITIEILSAGIVERKYCFPHAFVVKQAENFGNTDGTGTFTLAVKQKKDKMSEISIEGGYSL